MAILHNYYEFSEKFPPVLARASGLRANRHVELDASKFSSFSGVEGRSQKLLAPGFMAAAIAGSDKKSALKRSLLADALTASSTTAFNVSANTGVVFAAGDVLRVIAPYAVFVFASTWAAADTGTVVIDGRSLTITAAGATLADLATLLATTINADPILQFKVKAIASGANCYAYAKDMQSTYPISASESTAGSGTLTISGSLTALSPLGSIGTVSSVDVLTDEITLVAASSLTLPVGMPIGVAESYPVDTDGKRLGMISPNAIVDLLWGANTNYGLFESAAVYAARLPYWDDQLSALYPEISLV